MRTKGPPSRLLRLKIWRRPAVAGFIDILHRLQSELASWPPEDIDRPLAASVDGNGCPSVLSEFRRGVPILERVGAGRLDREQARALLRPLVSLVHRAHACGLAHGAIVPGNVIVEIESGRARLLDFGITPLLTSRQDHPTLAAADLDGFATLERRLRDLPIDPGPTGRL